jgi:K+/H+ antiporter YhaU regulatory subunit KhtT
VLQLIRQNNDGRIPIHTSVFVIDSAVLFGKTIAELEVQKLTDCTVLAVRRGGTLVRFPDLNFPLLEGDQITIAGTNAQTAFFQQVFGLSRMASHLVPRATRKIA